MSKIIKYKLVQSFRFDSIENEFIETRCIKRIYIKINEKNGLLPSITETQVLKSKIKRCNFSEISEQLYSYFVIHGQGSKEIDIEKEGFDAYMEPSFDLFELEPLH